MLDLSKAVHQYARSVRPYWFLRGAQILELEDSLHSETEQINGKADRHEFLSTKERLHRRLSQYWKVERLNIFLLPTVATFVVGVTHQNTLTMAFWVSMIATSFLLVVGTIALRMLHKRLDKDLSYETFWLPKLHIVQLPSLALVVVSSLLTTRQLISQYPSFQVVEYASLGFTVLAVLEYINYYHRQLQHFDNKADFQRLWTGKGFRRSQLARSLEKWRKSRSSLANDQFQTLRDKK